MVSGDSLEMGGLVARPWRKETLKCPGALPPWPVGGVLTSAEPVTVVLSPPHRDREKQALQSAEGVPGP